MARTSNRDQNSVSIVVPTGSAPEFKGLTFYRFHSFLTNRNCENPVEDCLVRGYNPLNHNLPEFIPELSVVLWSRNCGMDTWLNERSRECLLLHVWICASQISKKRILDHGYGGGVSPSGGVIWPRDHFGL